MVRIMWRVNASTEGLLGQGWVRTQYMISISALDKPGSELRRYSEAVEKASLNLVIFALDEFLAKDLGDRSRLISSLTFCCFLEAYLPSALRICYSIV